MNDKISIIIDGFNLYFGIRELHSNKFKWLNIHKLAQNMAKPDQELDEVFYCTARVKGNTKKQKRQNTYLDALTQNDRIQILYGKFKERRRDCPQCSFPIIKFEEKMSDVNIGVQLMRIAALKTVNVVIIVSGDTDIYSAIKTARQVNSKLKVIIAFPPHRFNNELKHVADGSFIIGKNILRKSMLDEEIPTKNGFILKRPATWN